LRPRNGGGRSAQVETQLGGSPARIARMATTRGSKARKAREEAKERIAATSRWWRGPRAGAKKASKKKAAFPAVEKAASKAKMPGEVRWAAPAKAKLLSQARLFSVEPRKADGGGRMSALVSLGDGRQIYVHVKTKRGRGGKKQAKATKD